jgi:type I restriction enzyme S subunit
MSSEWRSFEIEKLCTVCSSKRIFAADYVENGIPFFASKDVIDKALGSFTEPSAYISKKRFEEVSIKTGYPSVGDVLLSSVGNRSGISYVVKDESPFYFKDGNVLWFKNFGGLAGEFLNWWLRSNLGQDALNSIMIGSAQKALTIAGVQKLRIKVPILEEQNRIVAVLNSLDDRIVLLRETNTTLEAIAQALFKSWFIDFDPVHANAGTQAPSLPAEIQALFPSRLVESPQGLIPEGWEVCTIADVTETLGGATPNTKNDEFWNPPEVSWTSPKDLSGLNSPVFLETERKISKLGLSKISSGLLPIGTLLMSSRAPIGYLAMAQVPLAINQGYIAMPPGGKLPPLFMLYWCRQNMEVIENRANGSTFMEISKKAFRPIEIVLPPITVVDAFMATAETLFDRLVENEKQIRSLSDLRDTLLPRLISGQLRLPEAVAALAEVT